MMETDPGGNLLDKTCRFVFRSALYSAIFLFLALISWGSLKPLQDALLGTISPIATLVYLPFGVKLLLAYYAGWSSILLLAPGALLSNSMLWELPWNMSTVLALICSYGVAPLVFSILDFATGADRLSMPPRDRWRYLLVGALAASLLGSLAVSLFFFQSNVADALLAWPTFAVGDFCGLVVVAIAVWMIHR